MKRVLVIVLLLANVGLFAWYYNRHVDHITRTAMTTEPLPANTPTLVMINELDELPALKEPAPADPDLAPFSEVHDHVTAADRCIEVGPYTDTEARDQLRNWLRDYIAVLTIRAESVRQRRFFWVYLEPTNDETAQQEFDQLKEKGVEDLMLIRRGDLKNAISLGLFRSQDSVNRRLAELSKKGYQPVVVPRFETTDHYWVSAQLSEDHTSNFEIPNHIRGDAEQRSINCSTLQTATL